MELTLTLDIGNTYAKAGVFDSDGHLVLHEVYPKDNTVDLVKLLTQRSWKKVAYLMSGHLDPRVEEKLFKIGATILSSQAALPIKISYDTPQTLGMDRLAGILGAWHLSPRKNSLVIDSGTCLTIDLVTAEGNYLGGSISPGLHMRFEAMQKFTANLPLVEWSEEASFIGCSTESSMRSGVQNGLIFEINGFIECYQNNFSDLSIYICGGSGEYIHRRLKSTSQFEPFLVLKGLYNYSSFI